MAASAEVPLRWQALMDHVAGDAAAWAAWMREKIRMQRALASMLEQHAAASERALTAER